MKLWMKATLLVLIDLFKWAILLAIGILWVKGLTVGNWLAIGVGIAIVMTMAALCLVAAVHIKMESIEKKRRLQENDKERAEWEAKKYHGN